MIEDHYMNIAINEAKKAAKKGEIPVGAVIVENNKIVSKAHNLKDLKKITTKHAEIIAIEKACIKKGDWRLTNCTIYVTLQPCEMCLAALKQSRIENIVYGTEKVSNYNEKNPIINKVKNTDIHIECKEIIDTFFKEIRNNNSNNKKQ